MPTPIPINEIPWPRPETSKSNAARDRYEHAYEHAHWLVRAGELIQTAGWALGVGIFCGAVYSAHTVSELGGSAATWLTAGLAMGAMITIFFLWIIGVLVCARGRQLQVDLDSAVNSSPFLSDAQRAQVMSLS